MDTNQVDKWYISWGRIVGWMLLMSVGMGAFGAHLLKSRLNEQAQEWFSTAVWYQTWHGLGMLGVLMSGWVGLNKHVGGVIYTLFFGVVCFSGSLYGLVLWEMVSFFPRILLIPMTPIGGLLLAAGWFWWILGFQSPGDGSGIPGSRRFRAPLAPKSD